MTSEAETATDSPARDVLRVSDLPRAALEALLARYSIRLVMVADGEVIPGSYWGEPEAGIEWMTVYVRRDTPLHSLLHEASHIVCMSPRRRAGLHRDAGGDELEECAVCYLQVLLADSLPGVGRRRLMADMDAWGYSFRLGSAQRWYHGDAEDARDWLSAHGLLDEEGAATFKLRTA